MKTLLVPLVGAKTDRTALDAAGSLARQLDAHIHVLHVRSNIVELGMTLTMGQPAQAEEFWEQIAAEIKLHAQNARHSYDTFLRQHHFPVASMPSFVTGPSTSWTECEGRLTETTVAQGRFHDLLIATRGEIPAFSLAGIGQLLTETGRPLLLVPPHPPTKLCNTICVAWKNTPQAARALAAAMPLITQADKVHIVSIVEEQKTEDVMASLDQIASYLRWHSVDPDVRCLQTQRESASVLLRDYAKQAGTTLLVMGGYGHSRAREFLFGGMTREIMESCEIPVLMTH